MSEIARPRQSGGSVIGLLGLIYHSIVREIRKDHRHALLGLIMNITQTILLVATFYFMFTVLGLRSSAVRGDFMLYIMSGIFIYITHIKTVGAVVGSEGPTSAIMQHAPLNTLIAICAAALGALYIQVLSLLVVLFSYHVIVTPITIDQPAGAMGMVLLGWFTGVGVGTVFLALKPWFPGFVSIASSLYSRINMIASGKMFLANSLPGYMLAMFDWNPLFHTIDQARGFVFLNYSPHFSSTSYPLKVGIALIMIGLMGEFFTRKHASASWNAAR